MQNPLSEYRSNLFATHDNLDESFAYLNSMISTMTISDQQGINVAVRCLINTLAEEIDRVYHPSKNTSITTLVENYLNSHLAERVEELVNDQLNNAIGEYMNNEFDINDYEDNIDWSYRIESNLDKEVIRELVEETIKDNITFEVRVS